MTAAQPNATPRFIRKTELGRNEYRKNFRQLDKESIEAVTSPEADAVTPLMSKIYLKLVNAPDKYVEREGVLRFEAEWREGKQIKAWKLLCQTLGVASATANKALAWMHEQGVIGYFSGKNGVGIRIFLNRAASSIGVRQAPASQKILAFAPASSADARASRNEAAFNDSFAVLENLDTDFNPRTPDGSADERHLDRTVPKSPAPPTSELQSLSLTREKSEHVIVTNAADALPVNEIVQRLRAEIEPSLRMAAREAAAREHERTREWLENRGLPKAARVAQREAYNILRNQGAQRSLSQSACAVPEVDRSRPVIEAKPLTAQEITELAEICVALLDAQGQAIDLTLSEISAERGGCLLTEDTPRVRELAESMARQIIGEGN